ncbi:hypothetical protein HS125_09390 [bacterium]|nr:hypothetical protein [bacterium]
MALAHIDLYDWEGRNRRWTLSRLSPEILAGPGRHVVEWADVLPAALPRETVWVDFAVLHDGARRLEARWLEKIA